ncbi:MAG: DUF3788 domain-containing protein [bacterium]
MIGERILDGQRIPTDRSIAAILGRREGLWADLREYLADSYEHSPEMSFDGPKYGWAIRYRKSGKTLVTLYPERGSFTVLVVLGGNEVEKAQQTAGDLSKRVRDVMEKAEPRRDGRWLWIRPVTKGDIESVKTLLCAKRRPKAWV